MKQDIKLKHISTRVRPPRCVTFINENDKHWQSSILRIIENYSSNWGGSHNIIIPTNGNRIKKEFWKILQHYKPDYLNDYNKSYKELQKVEPLEFDKIIEENVQREIKKNNGKNKEELYKTLKDYLLNNKEIIKDLIINDQLKKDLIKKINPFYYNLKQCINFYRGQTGLTLATILKNYSILIILYLTLILIRTIPGVFIITKKRVLNPLIIINYFHNIFNASKEIIKMKKSYTISCFTHSPIIPILYQSRDSIELG